MIATPYPLCWPIGWGRTEPNRRRRANNTFSGNTFDRARRSLADELRKLNAQDIVLSTNQPVRLDGIPYANSRIITDAGVAVYFMRGNRKQLVLAQDKYVEIEANIRSLALAIEHLRGLERHGGDQLMEMAFSGFAALPAPGDRPSCWAILGLAEESGADAIERAYREAARSRHPDAGGSDSSMIELNQARDDAMRSAGVA